MKKEQKRRNRFYTIHVIEKELRDHVVEWSATVLTIFAALLNANLLRIGTTSGFALSFYLWGVSNVLWIAFALKHKHWGVFATFGILLIVNIWSIVQNKLWIW